MFTGIIKRIFRWLRRQKKAKQMSTNEDGSDASMEVFPRDILIPWTPMDSTRAIIALWRLCVPAGLGTQALGTDTL